MSIADKVTSMETHISDDYEGLVNLGIDLTGINKNIQNIRTCLDTVWNNLPKVSDTGTEVTLTPTLKGKLGIIPKGNSTQEPLNNLFNINDNLTTNKATLLTDDYIQIGYDNTEGSSLANCTAFTNNLSLQNNKAYKFVIEIKEVSGTGTLYATNRNENTNRGQFPANSYSLNELSAGQKLIFTSTSIADFTGTTGGLNTVMTIGAGASGFVTLRISVLEDTSITADTFYYCPYGATSPTPSFPFPIKSVTGNNNVVVRTKNLFNSDMFLEATGWTKSNGEYSGNTRQLIEKYPNTNGFPFPIPFKENTRYHISFKAYSSSSTCNCRFTFAYTDGTTSRTAFINSTEDYAQFNTTSENNKTIAKIYMSVSSYSDIHIKELQLEEGTSATTYVPYANQTKPLNLGTIELNKIGTYQDYIYKNNDNWYKKQVVGIVTLNGNNENWTVSNTGTANWFYSLTRNTDIMTGTNADILCNYYPYASISTDTNQGIALLATRVRIRWGTEDTTDNFKTWLGTHNVKIYYALGTPTDIEITDTQLIEQLEDIQKMQGYNGTTIITSTYSEGNAQMYLQVSGLKGE